MQSLNNIWLWLFSKKGRLEQITSDEIEMSKKMSPIRADEYKKARGYTRKVLSKIFKINPLEIPLNAMPGKPPELLGNKGFISLSHCEDAILIGWSPRKLGIDIERKDRNINFYNLMKKYYFPREIKKINNFNYENQKLEFIKYWVLKEAAIKWQRGNINKDIKNWEIKNNNKKALNLSLKLSLKTQVIDYKFWYLGITYENVLNVKDPILFKDFSI